ncbi:MAG: hypothetical protein AB7T49_14155 [Oligoflexales bacterium]
MKLFRISSLAIGLLLFMQQISLAAPSNPWECSNHLKNTNYLLALDCLKEIESEHVGTETEHSFNQAMAIVLSTLGQYQDANEYFDRKITMPDQPKVDIDAEAFKAVDAISLITKLAKDRQVIMINEAHHVSQNRVLTIQMLQPLFDQGFRYLAAETFYGTEMGPANDRGYPTQKTGFFLGDPLFGHLVREAKRIGFTLVAYEQEEVCSKTKEECRDERERMQAHNLINRVLKKDPKAKILVHAGYGHIDEVGNSSTFPWIPMAKYFRDWSDIDPLTIDQVSFRERGKKAVEIEGYRKALKDFKVNKASILVNKSSGTPYVIPTLEGHYDIQVFSPVTNLNDSRADWLATVPSKTKVQMENKCRDQNWCFVQIVRTQELQERFVPVDQFVSTAATANAYLPKGSYKVRYINRRSELEAEADLEI